MSPNAGRKDADMSPNPDRQPADYSFLGFTLDTRRQLLARGSQTIRLRPRTYDVLVYLVTHPGRLIAKRELVEAVWQDVAVTDDSLVQCLMEIRRALGEAHEVVKTVRGRGYLFDTAVQSVVPEAPGGLAEPAGNRAAEVDPLRRVEEPLAPRARRRALRAALVAAAVLIAGIGLTAWRVLVSPRNQTDAHAPMVSIRSLAVLPLDNLSGDPEQDYFADGMTEALITQLTKISALRVSSRTSVMRFKGTRKPVDDIARELHVDAVVKGTVIRSAERVSVTAQVTQANPERSLWAERYDRPLGDIVILQGTLAREISETIRVTLTPQEQSSLTSVRPVDREAYEAFIKGRYYWNKRTEESTKKAIEYFQQAVDNDPNYALAFTGLSDSQTSLALTEALQEVVPPRVAFPKARAAANRALEIDDSLAEAHASLAHIKFQYDRDWSGAEKEFKRAIALNPNYANAHHWYALSLMWMGRLDEALTEVTKARELDPLSLAINANVGFILAGARQYEEGIEQCRKTLDMDPNYAHAHFRLGQIHVLRGKYEDAIPELQKAISLSGRSPRASAELGLAYALLGNRRQAVEVLSDLKALSKRRYVSPFNTALIYSGLGDKDPALEWLQRAYEDGSPSMNLLLLSPAFTTIRSDPQFTALVRRIGLGR